MITVGDQYKNMDSVYELRKGEIVHLTIYILYNFLFYYLDLNSFYNLNLYLFYLYLNY